METNAESAVPRPSDLRVVSRYSVDDPVDTLQTEK